MFYILEDLIPLFLWSFAQKTAVETTSSSETSVHIYQTTWHHILEDTNIH
jgi:hypothetical protein